MAVQISGEGWTVGQLGYSYFANTAPGLSLAYGPGLLQVGQWAGIRRACSQGAVEEPASTKIKVV